jgi:hypothetical protein
VAGFGDGQSSLPNNKLDATQRVTTLGAFGTLPSYSWSWLKLTWWTNCKMTAFFYSWSKQLF